MPDFAVPQSVGRLRVDISEALLITVVDVLLTAWRAVVSRGVLTRDSLEDPITDRLYDDIYAEKTRRNLDDIDFGREPQSNLAHEPRPVGYIDVKVCYNSWQKTDYFAIECKRVWSCPAGPVKQYIDEGVMRFVMEKYSPGHLWGGMVGYVMDAQLDQCAQLIGNMLASHRRAETAVRMEWTREKRFADYSHIYTTRHQQQQCGKEITLIHVLLPLVVTANTEGLGLNGGGPVNSPG